MLPQDEGAQSGNVYLLPLHHQWLVYAPLHSFAALVDRKAAQQVQDALRNGRIAANGQLSDIIQLLRSHSDAAPAPRSGELTPAFLGLIPTRACNLACDYCGFLTSDGTRQAMDLKLAGDAIDWYLRLVDRTESRTAEVHFFGGEPFCAPGVVDFAYHYARLKGRELGLSLRFEVATNGVLEEERCRWLADSIDSVILSLDGPREIQDRHRHRGNGAVLAGQGYLGSFEEVVRSARILSEGSSEFSIRTCVTAATVDRVPEIAAWFCEEFRPASVCFEPVQPTTRSSSMGLHPPDPWSFALNSIQAARILESYGVEHVYAAADISARRVSFCPVGRDVVIVSPDGSIDACYLLPRDWQAKGLDLRLGRLEAGSAVLDHEAVEATRGLNVWNTPICAQCFCRWHCAGGCHVNHAPPATRGAYDDLCIQTRVISLRNILKAVDRDELAEEHLRSRRVLEGAVLQPSDRIGDVRIEP